MAFKFEKLIVWQKAVDLSDSVHQLTKSFPIEEVYALTSQMRNAANGVSLNIAEGSAGPSNREFNRFLGVALRADVEIVGCLYLAQRRGYINEDDFKKIYEACEELLVMINSLRRKVNETGTAKARKTEAK